MSIDWGDHAREPRSPAANRVFSSRSESRQAVDEVMQEAFALAAA